ncbi:MAG: iron-containing alcohol dehydrogenase [Pseudomonadota bacterium]
MTLITYITRVHFADEILDEALRSELEINNKCRPLLIVDKIRDPSYEDTFQRVLSGVPKKHNVQLFEVEDNLPYENTAIQIANKFREQDCDILLAMGSNNTIDLGKLSRVIIAHDKPLAPFTIAEGGSRRIGEKPLPELYVVPNIMGFCSAVSAHAKLVHDDGTYARLMCRKLVPTVTICDPTLTTGAELAVTASTGVDAIARCLEAYLSPNYNPPADGIAFDGLRRAVKYLPKVLEEDNAQHRREMMAASLNSALALQKGLGMTQVIGDGLEEAYGEYVNLGSIRRIILPKVVAMVSNHNLEKLDALSNLFNADGRSGIVNAIEDYFSRLPLADRFSSIGITNQKLSDAAFIAAKAMSTSPGLEVIDSGPIEEMLLGSF